MQVRSAGGVVVEVGCKGVIKRFINCGTYAVEEVEGIEIQS